MQVAAGGSRAFAKDPKTGYPLITNAPNAVINQPDSINTINYQYIYDTAQLVTMGSVQPTLTGGLLINLRYKNFFLFAQMDGRLGGYTYSESYTYAMATGSPKNSLEFRDKAHGPTLILVRQYMTVPCPMWSLRQGQSARSMVAA
jgi:iron complex outermembrane receptor protein